LLKACPVDVVCIDSKLMAESGGAEITSDLHDTSSHVPVMLSKRTTIVPGHYEDRHDVVINESMFSTVGSRLIEEL